jgi:hypothetical protein
MTTLTKPKETPILFAPDLAQKVWEGSKTVTRRLVKPQPAEWITSMGFTAFTPPGHISGRGIYKDQGPGEKFFKNPFGGPGDLLWVRETWAIDSKFPEEDDILAPSEVHRVIYKGATVGHSPMAVATKWKPSIHMPKWACRTWLKIKSVRVERVRQIREEELAREGYALVVGIGPIETGQRAVSSRLPDFILSWNARYPGSWDRNEWCWRLEFERTEAPNV